MMNCDFKCMKGIAFDIDGVVADVMKPIRENCRETFGHDYDHTKETSYDLGPALGIDDEAVVTAYVNHCLSKWEEIPIDPTAGLLMESLYVHTGRAIPFVTHRHRNPMETATYDLMESFIKVPFTISFAGGTSYQTHKKSVYIPEGYCFVEDRRATAVALASEGILTFLVRTPYNKLDSRQYMSRIIEVNDLKDVYDIYFA